MKLNYDEAITAWDEGRVVELFKFQNAQGQFLITYSLNVDVDSVSIIMAELLAIFHEIKLKLYLISKEAVSYIKSWCPSTKPFRYIPLKILTCC